jgi:hypothetical protein
MEVRSYDQKKAYLYFNKGILIDAHFKEINGGTEMRDILFYEVAFGFIGKILHRLFISKRVKEIFEYREQKIKELFGSL